MIHISNLLLIIKGNIILPFIHHVYDKLKHIINLENKRWNFFVLPIFDDVTMVGYTIFWVVDAIVVAFLVRIVLFLHFNENVYCKKMLLQHFYWLHLNNYSSCENKCFNLKYQKYDHIAFVTLVNSTVYRCVIQYAVVYAHQICNYST